MSTELEAKFDVHVAREEGQFEVLHTKIDALADKLDQVIEERDELKKALRGSLIKLAFATLGAALIGGWKWAAAKLF
jgi:hypothetical protein